MRRRKHDVFTSRGGWGVARRPLGGNAACPARQGCCLTRVMRTAMRQETYHQRAYAAVCSTASRTCQRQTINCPYRYSTFPWVISRRETGLLGESRSWLSLFEPYLQAAASRSRRLFEFRDNFCGAGGGLERPSISAGITRGGAHREELLALVFRNALVPGFGDHPILPGSS